MEIRHFYLRGTVAEGTTTQTVALKDNLADGFTKGLKYPDFEVFQTRLGLEPLPAAN